MSTLLFAEPEAFMAIMDIGREGAEVFGTTLLGGALAPIGVAALVVAFVMPLVLSLDAFGYVACGDLVARHLNPWTPVFLAKRAAK